MPCQWKLRGSQTQEPNFDLNSWSEALNISPFLARLLWQRGISSLQELDVFLSPGLRHLSPLKNWPDVKHAAQTLSRELSQNKTLAVWGDYDVDGVSATALVVDFLRQKGFSPLSFLPHRLDHGYGLNLQALEQLRNQGVDILLTVDCGISEQEVVQRARELGMTVIITDHHLPGENLPQAQCIVNPRLKDCPNQDLAGVGVAFLLMAALNRLLPGDTLDMRQFLDLVALGTIADVVNLKGENRVLVKNGLLLLSEARRPGIFALKEASDLPPTAKLGTGQVGFSLAPRLNAAGRVDNPETALKLLLAPDLESARPLAQKLRKLNKERQKTEEKILEQALKQAQTQEQNPGLVLYDPSWHPGVIGIVASRVAEEFCRPCLLLTQDQEGLQGSGRSIPEFDLYSGLNSCSDILTGFGGHRQAAGLRLKEHNLEQLKTLFAAAVNEQLPQGLPQPCRHVDAQLGFKQIDLTLVKELELLQPFGPGNPQPVFYSRKLTVNKHKIFGKKHVSLEVKENEGGISLLGKAWRQAGTLGPEIKGRTIQLAFTPRLNNYNGLASIDLDIRDWRLS